MALTASIIIPSYRTKFIDETILSIANQTVRPKEVIILYQQYPDEAGATRINHGIAMSTSDAFILLGDDDKLAPTFLEETLKKMEDEQADIVYTDMEQIGLEEGFHSPPGWRPDVFHESFGIYFTSLTRKSIWERVGGYDSLAGPCIDWDFWWMCAEKDAKAIHLPKPLFIYRRHDNQDSQNLSEEMFNWSHEYILDKHKKSSLIPKRYKEGITSLK